MLEEKYIEQKKQRLDDVTFAMTPFCVKKFLKIKVVGLGKIP